MAGKHIALDIEDYDLLKRQKRPGETFSDVVKRLAAPRRPLTDFIGIWKELPAKETRAMKPDLRRGRELDRRRVAGLRSR